MAVYEIFRNIEFPWPVAQIVLQHHERINGCGYPFNLIDNQILLKAKILAGADVVEAISAYCPYRPAFPIEQALLEIDKNKNILYDATVVDACLVLFREKKISFEQANIKDSFLKSLII